MNKLLIILMLLTGCGQRILLKEHISWASSVCEPNQGLEYLYRSLDSVIAGCNNGVEIKKTSGWSYSE